MTLRNTSGHSQKNNAQSIGHMTCFGTLLIDMEPQTYNTEAESIMHIILLKEYILIPLAPPWKKVVEVSPFK